MTARMPLSGNSAPGSGAVNINILMVKTVPRKAYVLLWMLGAMWPAASTAHVPIDPNWKPEPLPIAMMINLNGFLCMEVIHVKPTKTAHIYEVACKTDSGKARTTYIYNEKTGKATAR